jgi:predicted TPR repeat methyltransferase
MPKSSGQGKTQIIDWVNQYSEINTILDVGCGVGTYATLLKENCPKTQDAEWWGIEVWTPYIDKYNLNSLYDHIINVDAREVDWGQFPNLDLVIFGDILEHMEKEQSQELVAKALKKSKLVIISIPVKHSPQGAWGGNPFEIHVKDNWTHEEVLSSFPNIAESVGGKKIGVYLLKDELCFG